MNDPLVLPAELPLLALKNKVILPGGVARINLAGNKEGALYTCTLAILRANTAFNMCALAELEFWNSNVRGALVGLVPVVRGSAGFNSIATAARVLKLDRFEGKDDTPAPDSEAAVLVAQFKEEAATLIELLKARVPAISKLQGLIDRTLPHLLCDLLAMAIDASFEERLAILDTLELAPRFELGLQLLRRQLLVLKTASQVGETLSSRSRLSSNSKGGNRGRTVLRGPRGGEQDGAAGGAAEEESTLARLQRMVAEANMPPEALKAASQGLKKVADMEQSQQMGPEHQKTVAWLEWMVELPWSKSTSQEREMDLSLARQRLDDDHYGLEKIKRRIVEYAAVRWLNPGAKGSILCLVGPPGVGKTSLAKSIAHTLGREFYRVSLGGVRDEADIRGFNRTYVGSQPGRIIQGLRQSKANDPVLLLDEIDKISTQSANGNPSAAMLEVLDPAQNNTFVDHYIGTPFDLSKIVFIATANTTDTIPAPLLDRMEVIRIPGYTLDEKVNIAAKYIVPRQLQEHGIRKEELEIPETGVRNLERNVAAVCRAVAVRMVEKGVRLVVQEPMIDAPAADALLQKALPAPSSPPPLPSMPPPSASSTATTSMPPPTAAPVPGSAAAAAAAAAAMPSEPRLPRIVIEKEALLDILGPPRFVQEEDPAQRLTSPGIAMASKMPGSGHLKLTGSLGDVIQESAHLALAWLRSNAGEAGIRPVGSSANVMDKIDVHIHFPEGAVGKDGPSAGVTLVTVLTSLLSDRVVRNDTAMTGEITLSGAVLPVGGIENKVLAAHRLGVKRIVMPRQNYERDLAELSPAVRNAITFIPVRSIREVLQNTLVGGLQEFASASKL
eukprot:gene3588-8106_t